ncbi:uncharacterized protein LOC143583114 [Bidens hawaiensis]|uniref:uncharacterized protein LOC143583114 n=1 Tax=Bidens hawaiensis TaxID=980011 RepID=UPI004049D61F
MELEEWENCFWLMNTAVWVNGSDRWIWLGDKEGRFSVKSVKKLIVNAKDSGDNYIMKWSKWIPNKWNIRAWRAEMDRLPTRRVLERRNIRVTDSVCPLCDSEVETVDHIMTGCGVSTMVWEHISRWCNVPPIFGFSVRDILELHKSTNIGANKKEVFHGIIIIALWKIWKARNEHVFEGKEINLFEIIGDIKASGFLWYKYSSKFRSLVWSNWCNFDFIISCNSLLFVAASGL